MTGTEKTVHFAKINQIIANNIEKIYRYFDINYKSYNDRVACPCFIHGSDNEESLTLYTSGRKYIGNFVCWTAHCENMQGSGGGAINLLSHLLTLKLNKPFNLMQTVDWLTHFLNLNDEELSTSNLCQDKLDFSRSVESFQIKERPKTRITRDIVRSSLKIPANYYINRKYTPEILDRYDVGLCTTKGKEMYMRVTVPVYENGYMVGCVGRNINDKCDKCGLYHQSESKCPESPLEKKWAQKWINSTGFSKSQYLYNFDNAKPYINKTNNAILVEGQGDIWRLEEAGIKIGLGIFGCSLSDEQKKILDSLECMNIYLALDNDDAGKLATEATKQKLSRFYNISYIDIGNKDIGDITNLEDVRKLFRGIQYC